jgi:hypothetical protein
MTTVREEKHFYIWGTTACNVYVQKPRSRAKPGPLTPNCSDKFGRFEEALTL